MFLYLLGVFRDRFDPIQFNFFHRLLVCLVFVRLLIERAECVKIVTATFSTSVIKSNNKIDTPGFPHFATKFHIIPTSAYKKEMKPFVVAAIVVAFPDTPQEVDQSNNSVPAIPTEF